ncbi:ECF-type sigma factor [Adhaeretor mobilis]|uniref:RNA polymerase sigma factor n=1 Tax=Adhaeretor mobilis TaxID=1930276 RepID=A0A517MX42_9BACT|nr:ECF-type sigma factor [Adhaeretor mobilis]QDS99441.1 RNA polymerase sigma factor [Adhaeretor mobilis]
MSSDHSITLWIANLKLQDDDQAQREIWERYFQRLVGLARFKLGNAPRRSADEEDVALSVLHCFFAGVSEGRFPELRDRTNLWPLLAKITSRKAINQRRHELRQKRGGGRVRGESVFLNAEDASMLGLAEVMADDLTPAYLATLEEERLRLFDALPDDVLRSVARKKLEGFQNAEIADELGVTERTVERKLNRIRNLWLSKIGPGRDTEVE